jgi:quinol-cytochrome oxidoreductase complex cytochrome b subunit
MNFLFNKVKASFKAATKGEESVQNVIWWWGVCGYLGAFFIANHIVKISNIRTIDILVSLLMIIYFGWHFYAMRKCAPKKPKLSKEEKKKLREEARKDFTKKLARKFFLQESITKWDPILVVLAIDVFSIATFLQYVIR